MPRIILISILVLSLVVVGAFIPACGSSTGPDGGDDPGDDPPDGPDADWPENAIGLPEIAELAADSVANRYDELRVGMDAAEARTALLGEIAGWDVLQDAELLSDGSSIQLVFTDSTRSVLLTDEIFFSPLRGRHVISSSITASAVTRASWKDEVTRLLRERDAGDRLDCGNIRVPDSHKVSLVNMAGGIKESTHELITGLKDYLVSLGWDPEDIDIKQRESYNDFNFTPDTMFDQTGYGLVFFLGQGGFTTSAEGDEYFALECFRGGDYQDDFEDTIPRDRWDDFLDYYREEGTMVGKSAYGDDGNVYKEIYVREDLLAEEMILDEGAMVHVLSNFGWETADELMSAGAGNVSGWNNGINLEHGIAAYEAFLEAMVNGDGGAPMDALHANWSMGEAGEFFQGDVFSQFTATVEPYSFMLPAQLRFEAPFDCLEEGTEYYDVEINYPDCPEHNSSFQFFPGGDFSMTGMPPVGAELSLTARSADGGILGRNDMDLPLTGGPNDIDLCPCEGYFVAGFTESDIPPGCDELIAEIDYDNDEIPDRTLTVGLPSTGFYDLIPGSATVGFHATAGGEIYGSTSMDVDISCDGDVPLGCFGWFTFDVVEWPEATAEIVVETTDPTNIPNPLVFTPGESPEMYGFRTYEDVTLFCSARDGAGGTLGTDNREVMVLCGSNEISLEFDRYGIILEADPDTLHAGWEWSTLTATVRYFTDFDIDIPTGEPIANKTVTFSTDLGEFFDGIFMVQTDANGIAEVILISQDPGVATVIATTDDEIVASDPVQILFKPALTIILDNRSSDFDGDDGSDCYQTCWVEYNCIHLDSWFNSWRIHDIDFSYHAWNYSFWTVPIVGDTLTYAWSPISGCADPEAEPPLNHPYMSSVYMHYFYGFDYAHQITLQLTAAHIPMSGTAEAHVVLEDPTLRNIQVPQPNRGRPDGPIPEPVLYLKF